MLAPLPGGNPGSTTDINIECLFLGHMKHCTIVVADRFAKYLRVKSSWKPELSHAKLRFHITFSQITNKQPTADDIWKQECIPVGSVPSAAVAVCWGVSGRGRVSAQRGCVPACTEADTIPPPCGQNSWARLKNCKSKTPGSER